MRRIKTRTFVTVDVSKKTNRKITKKQEEKHQKVPKL